MQVRAGSAADDCEKYIKERGIDNEAFCQELRYAYRAGWGRGYHDGLVMREQKADVQA